MYLHLGQDTIVNERDIVGVFDLDNSTVSRHTRDFLSKAQKEGRVVNVGEDLPKSFVLCRRQRGHRDGAGETRIYLSQLSTATLLRRAEEGGFEGMENR